MQKQENIYSEAETICKQKLFIKQKYNALILAFLLGFIGVHDFYLGNNKKGGLKILYLLLGSLFLGIGVGCFLGTEDPRVFYCSLFLMSVGSLVLTLPFSLTIIDIVGITTNSYTNPSKAVYILSTIFGGFIGYHAFNYDEDKKFLASNLVFFISSLILFISPFLKATVGTLGITIFSVSFYYLFASAFIDLLTICFNSYGQLKKWILVWDFFLLGFFGVHLIKIQKYKSFIAKISITVSMAILELTRLSLYNSANLIALKNFMIPYIILISSLGIALIILNTLEISNILSDKYRYDLVKNYAAAKTKQEEKKEVEIENKVAPIKPKVVKPIKTKSIKSINIPKCTLINVIVALVCIIIISLLFFLTKTIWYNPNNLEGYDKPWKTFRIIDLFIFIVFVITSICLLIALIMNKIFLNKKEFNISAILFAVLLVANIATVSAVESSANQIKNSFNPTQKEINNYLYENYDVFGPERVFKGDGSKIFDDDVGPVKAIELDKNGAIKFGIQIRHYWSEEPLKYVNGTYSINYNKNGYYVDAYRKCYFKIEATYSNFNVEFYLSDLEYTTSYDLMTRDYSFVLNI